MSAYAAPMPAVTATDRLSVTLFFAVCAHLVLVLGVTFVHEERSRRAANTLDVVLVQRRSEHAPEEAEFLGQANQDGGGELDTVARPATPLPSPLISNAPAIAAASPPVPQLVPLEAPPAEVLTADVAAPRPEPEPTLVVAVDQPARDKVSRPPPQVRTPPQRKVAKAPPAPQRPTDERAKPAPAPQAESAPVQSIDAAALVRRSLAMASLSAEVDQRLQAYAKRPRQKWISARTREHKYAAYMEAWRAKVERVGNLNYPDEARRRSLSGDLLLDVAIRADGSVVEISVRRSSGHKVLDDAAARIVRLAAPFAPFPKSIKEETDILHVQRTWRFLTGNRFSGN
jgi:protein TonB